MKINYNVTGTERKSLAGAISQELNAPTKYLGAPTFAYEVGGYNIDRTGTLTGEDNRDLVADLQGLHSFKAVSEEYDTALPETPEAPAFEDLAMTAEEELGMGRQRRDPMGEDGMQASDVPEQYHYRAELSDPDSPERMEVFSADNDEDALRQAFEYATGGVILLELHELDENYDEVRAVDIPRSSRRLIIEMPKDGFTETSIANIRKLVDSKAALIKKAVGADSLPIEETDNTLRFPWFASDATPEAANAYAKFISAVCGMAKEQKRITAKEKEVENEKYAFRCFLLRLGFIGGDYKDERKILLANLSGNGSFKSGERRPQADVEPDVSADEMESPAEIHSDSNGTVSIDESGAESKAIA